MSALFVEFKSDFMPNGFPDFTESDEKKRDYIKMVERYCELLAPFDAQQVRAMFVAYIRSGGTFFPRVGDLTKHQPKKEEREGHYVPNYEESLEVLKRIEEERLQREEEEKNLSPEMREERERIKRESYERIRKICERRGLYGGRGKISIDFDDSETGND